MEGPRGGAVSYERGTPVGGPMFQGGRSLDIDPLRVGVWKVRFLVSADGQSSERIVSKLILSGCTYEI